MRNKNNTLTESIMNNLSEGSSSPYQKFLDAVEEELSDRYGIGVEDTNIKGNTATMTIYLDPYDYSEEDYEDVDFNVTETIDSVNDEAEDMLGYSLESYDTNIKGENLIVTLTFE